MQSLLDTIYWQPRKHNVLLHLDTYTRYILLTWLIVLVCVYNLKFQNWNKIFM